MIEVTNEGLSSQNSEVINVMRLQQLLKKEILRNKLNPSSYFIRETYGVRSHLFSFYVSSISLSLCLSHSLSLSLTHTPALLAYERS